MQIIKCNCCVILHTVFRIAKCLSTFKVKEKTLSVNHVNNFSWVCAVHSYINKCKYLRTFLFTFVL